MRILYIIQKGQEIMIETLQGIKETVNYKQMTGFMLFDNHEYEAYPSHWHTPIEIIVPIKNTYEIICKSKTYQLKEGDFFFINSGVLHSMEACEGERLIFQADFSMLQNVSEIEAVLSSIPSVIHITDGNATDIHKQLFILFPVAMPPIFQNRLLY